MRDQVKRVLGGILLFSSALLAAPASAEPTEPAATEVPIPPPPSPYSAPFGLRAVVAGNAVRLDTSLASSSTPAGSATSVVEFLSGSMKVADHLAVNAKLGWVDLTSSPATTGMAITNLALGGLYGAQQSDFKFAAAANVVLPLASGGGDAPTPAAKSAIASGALARASWDNAMFGPNDLSVCAGGDVAYVKSGFMAQAEATVIEAFRVRAAGSQPDATKTNSLFGLAVGYTVIPQLTAGAELRYQRFLSTPAAVGADPTGALRDSLSLAATARAHFAYQKVKLQPGFSATFGLDDPLKTRSVVMYQLDLIASF